MRKSSSFVANLIPRLLRERRGSTLIEFAFAAPVVASVVIATMELGMVMFTSTLMESGLRDAARFGITGQVIDGSTRLEHIISIIDERTLGLVDMDDADIQVFSYPVFGDVGRGEDFVDGNANGAFDPGETFTDENGNGAWDSDLGVAGAGESGEVVVYRIYYNWSIMTPFAASFVGQGGLFTIEASIAVRNEPWETEGIPL